MTDQSSIPSPTFDRAERPLVAIGVAAGFAAFFSAAACCVIPAALALAGIGGEGLAAVVPWHWPLTIASAFAVVMGWRLYFRKRRVAAASAATFWLLLAATLFIALSAVWRLWFEAPLRDWLLSL